MVPGSCMFLSSRLLVAGTGQDADDVQMSALLGLTRRRSAADDLCSPTLMEAHTVEGFALYVPPRRMLTYKAVEDD
ncbi:hypothetical protein B0H63DRAFT_520121 [Podospora didyma]|uniref:Uncharacterized protein n=1 Tax=Podospora didyma TaxID=330526 RepID=A0AAE0P0C1_9PEZI|nr:hypothetical protein B0H63DRAFT_520121 [Podospora didyma]